MRHILDGFLWWSGAVFWAAWIAFAAYKIAPFIAWKWRWRNFPKGSWYGTKAQRDALRGRNEQQKPRSPSADPD
jgi:hypothetical protein